MRVLAALTLLPLLSVVTGCGGAPTADGTVADVPIEDAWVLQGTRWRLASIGELQARADAEVGIRFDAEQVLGKGGVNNFTGPWGLRDGRLAFGALAATRKLGPPLLQQQEDRLIAALQTIDGAVRRGDQLVLQEGGEDRLTFDPKR